MSRTARVERATSETKLVVDLIYQGGLTGMHKRISDTAEWGDYVAGPRIFTEHTSQSDVSKIDAVFVELLEVLLPNGILQQSAADQRSLF